MAKKKNRTSRMSSGNRVAINKAREEKRQAKFSKKREEGRAYEYKPIPYAKGTKEYAEEKRVRQSKNVDRKTPVARMTSLFKKLDNELVKNRVTRKETKERAVKKAKIA